MILDVTSAGVMAVAAGMFGIGFVRAIRKPTVVDVTVPIANLPEALSGFVIAQISDIHVGPTIHKEFIDEVVAAVNSTNADLVAFTGDLVDGSVERLREHTQPLSQMKSTHGSFFITGNHEYYVGPDAWIAHLETLGIRALRNAHVEVGRDGAAFTLAGVEDYAGQSQDGGGPDLARALAGRDPGKPVVLLAHQPKAVYEARDAGVAVQLSGHTHGGQMWPFGIFVGLLQPAVSGLHQFGPTSLYVSCGTGFWGPPMRVGAPAEVTLVELVPATG